MGADQVSPGILPTLFLLSFISLTLELAAISAGSPPTQPFLPKSIPEVSKVPRHQRITPDPDVNALSSCGSL